MAPFLLFSSFAGQRLLFRVSLARLRLSLLCQFVSPSYPWCRRSFVIDAFCSSNRGKELGASMSLKYRASTYGSRDIPSTRKAVHLCWKSYEHLYGRLVSVQEMTYKQINDARKHFTKSIIYPFTVTCIALRGNGGRRVLAIETQPTLPSCSCSCCRLVICSGYTTTQRYIQLKKKHTMNQSKK